MARSFSESASPSEVTNRAATRVGDRCALSSILLFRPGLRSEKVGGRNTDERLLAILPLVGKGTLADPKRPRYAPLAAAMPAANRTGIIAYHYVLSADGNSALVEFVAVHRSVFQTVLAGASQGKDISTR